MNIRACINSLTWAMYTRIVWRGSFVSSTVQSRFSCDVFSEISRNRQACVIKLDYFDELIFEFAFSLFVKLWLFNWVIFPGWCWFVNVPDNRLTNRFWANSYSLVWLQTVVCNHVTLLKKQQISELVVSKSSRKNKSFVSQPSFSSVLLRILSRFNGWKTSLFNSSVESSVYVNQGEKGKKYFYDF